VLRADNFASFLSRLPKKPGSLNFLDLKACTGTSLPFTITYENIQHAWKLNKSGVTVIVIS
jgi:hypothetical protein